MDKCKNIPFTDLKTERTRRNFLFKWLPQALSVIFFGFLISCRPNPLLIESTPVLDEYEKKWRERIKKMPKKLIDPNFFWWDEDEQRVKENLKKVSYDEKSYKPGTKVRVLPYNSLDSKEKTYPNRIDFDNIDELKRFYELFRPLQLPLNSDPLTILKQLSDYYVNNVKPSLYKMRENIDGRDTFYRGACLGASLDTFVALCGLTDIKAMFVDKKKYHSVLAVPINGIWYIVDNDFSPRTARLSNVKYPIILPVEEYVKTYHDPPDEKRAFSLPVDGDPFNLSISKPPWLILPP